MPGMPVAKVSLQSKPSKLLILPLSDRRYRLDATPVTSDARNAIATASSAAVPDDDANEDGSKRPRTSRDDKKDRSGGQNKGRRFAKIADQGVQLCKGFANGRCTFVDAKT
jgi:hypothetical protein